MMNTILSSNLVLLLIAVVFAYPAKVTVAYDRTVDFSGFQAYAWARGAQATNPLIDRRIIEAVDSRLGATGLQRVDGSGDPDLVVVYYAATNTPLEANTANLEGWGPGWAWDRGLAGAPVGEVEHIGPGDLVVDIARAKDKRFIWRGLATALINDKPAKVSKRLSDALDKMFQKFPPPYKKQV